MDRTVDVIFDIGILVSCYKEGEKGEKNVKLHITGYRFRNNKGRGDGSSFYRDLLTFKTM